MARARIIKPGFYKDGDLFDAEAESGLPLRVAYSGLWCIADREGRFEWKPRELKLDVLPFDNVDFVDVLAALESAGFIVSYEVDGLRIGFIPTFLRHQTPHPRERQSDLPPPIEAGTSHVQATAKDVQKPDLGVVGAVPRSRSVTPMSEQRQGSEAQYTTTTETDTDTNTAVQGSAKDVPGPVLGTALDRPTDSGVLDKWPDLQQYFPDPVHQAAVAALLDKLPARAAKKLAEILPMWMVGGRAAFTPTSAEIATAFAEYEGAGEPIHVWGYVKKVHDYKAAVVPIRSGADAGPPRTASGTPIL